MSSIRPVALVTGVGRSAGIMAAVAERLADDGWDLAAVYSSDYDARVNGGLGDVKRLADAFRARGAAARMIDTDLADPAVASRLFDRAEELGPVSALVMGHAESVNGGILDTTVESFDRHLAVNARGGWLLVREFARRFQPDAGDGRIVALTSDAIHGEVAYGASKGALDRVVLAAARELGPLGVTCNLVNPGPIDTGWMSDATREHLRELTPLGRLGAPADTASIVSFLLSPDGGWVTGQLLHSDGGFSTP